MTRLAEAQHGVLVLSCKDAPGIVHAVSGLLVDQRCPIVESHQFHSDAGSMFFMRVEFADVEGAPLDLARLRRAFEGTAEQFGMSWRLVDVAERQRVIIMVSQYAHCLNDLLFRVSVGELHLDVVAVVSNHPDLRGIADFYGIPFRHIPVTRETKPQAEAALLDIVRQERVELVVLARYMQILSDGLCAELQGRAINIQHSMLPSLKGRPAVPPGARPRPQVHRRDGPLRHRGPGRGADHRAGDAPRRPLARPGAARGRGREAETRALVRAVRWHTREPHRHPGKPHRRLRVTGGGAVTALRPARARARGRRPGAPRGAARPRRRGRSGRRRRVGRGSARGST